MELVKNKEELHSLTAVEIYNRMIALYKRVYLRKTPEQMREIKGLVRDSRRLFQAKVVTANIQSLTEDEVKSANMYLMAMLSIIKNKYLTKKKRLAHEPDDDFKGFYHTTEHLIATFFNILSHHVYRRGYQRAKMYWMWYRDRITVGLRPIPKELDDRDISLTLSLSIAPYFLAKFEEIPQCLETVIQQAQTANDEKMVKKATALRSIIVETHEAYKKEWASMSTEQKFLSSLARALKERGSYGKVIELDKHIELNPHLQVTYPFFQEVHTWWNVKPGKEMVLDEHLHLSMEVRRIADELGLNCGTKELRPVISTTERGYIKIGFTWEDKPSSSLV